MRYAHIVSVLALGFAATACNPDRIPSNPANPAVSFEAGVTFTTTCQKLSGSDGMPVFTTASTESTDVEAPAYKATLDESVTNDAGETFSPGNYQCDLTTEDGLREFSWKGFVPLHDPDVPVTIADTDWAPTKAALAARITELEARPTLDPVVADQVVTVVEDLNSLTETVNGTDGLASQVTNLVTTQLTTDDVSAAIEAGTVGFITAADLPDLSPYALATAIPDVSGFATTAGVNTLTGAIDARLDTVSGRVSSLETAGYLTAADLPSLVDLSPYALDTDLAPYAKTADLPDVSGFVTLPQVDTHLTAEGYAKIADIPGADTTLAPRIAAVEGKLVEVVDGTTVGDYIDDLDLGGTVDLTPYALVTQVSALETVVEDLETAGFITAADLPAPVDLTPYALDADLVAKADASRVTVLEDEVLDPLTGLPAAHDKIELVETDLATKAEATVVTALSTTVSQKADATTVASINGEVDVHENRIDNLEASRLGSVCLRVMYGTTSVADDVQYVALNGVHVPTAATGCTGGLLVTGVNPGYEYFVTVDVSGFILYTHPTAITVVAGSVKNVTIQVTPLPAEGTPACMASSYGVGTNTNALGGLYLGDQCGSTDVDGNVVVLDPLTQISLVVGTSCDDANGNPMVETLAPAASSETVAGQVDNLGRPMPKRLVLVATSTAFDTGTANTACRVQVLDGGSVLLDVPVSVIPFPVE